MANASTKTLDHILHLVPPATLPECIDAFRKLGFTISPGGTHSHGLTANALVIFADGTYLELAHFVAPPHTNSTHGWAQKQPGWIDYAFSGNGGAPSIAEAINARAEKEGTAVRYEPEIRGERKRDEDGALLQWTITGRVGGEERFRFPFYCGDLTPRELRVPLEPSNVTHPNTAQGIAYFKILVPQGELDGTVHQLTSVLGSAPRTSTSSEIAWDLDPQPSRVTLVSAPTQLILRAAQDEEELAYVRARGASVYEVGFFVLESKDELVGGTPYGRVAWVRGVGDGGGA
ncbi:glyoxalase-like domain-containing protein [Dichomitus squalens]|uniref:Glyoxalase-like domain-containing protein n=1 Tax=Dichomitus squalens TaxID=114155 RepID=A0A4Q9MJ70_9APHY|nr:glyoxalase-like domain-containing protein [Dichomitus squalens]